MMRPMEGYPLAAARRCAARLSARSSRSAPMRPRRRPDGVLPALAVPSPRDCGQFGAQDIRTQGIYLAVQSNSHLAQSPPPVAAGNERGVGLRADLCGAEVKKFGKIIWAKSHSRALPGCSRGARQSRNFNHVKHDLETNQVIANAISWTIAFARLYGGNKTLWRAQPCQTATERAQPLPRRRGALAAALLGGRDAPCQTATERAQPLPRRRGARAAALLGGRDAPSRRWAP